MPLPAADLARRLASEAEAVCRHYLSNGRRAGRYWLVGDVANTPGRSLFVRLHGSDCGVGAAGKWTDAATRQHGDLLDLIALNRGLTRFADTMDEARAFLCLPHDTSEHEHDFRPAGLGSSHARRSSRSTDPSDAARRLFAISQPIHGTRAEHYLRNRGITSLRGTASLRFHPRCYYRRHEEARTEIWPAMIAGVTDLAGDLTGVQRTWLDPSGRGKAAIPAPRRAMGHLLGHGVRLGPTTGSAFDAMAAGEGIETMLSLRCIMTTLPMTAALSAAHLAALQLPPALRRLYIARDLDPAGEIATARLADRARDGGIEVLVLSSRLGDFNDDLRRLGIDRLRADLRAQLAPEDFSQFAFAE
jgi:Toprim domain